MFAIAPGPGQESVWDYPRPPIAVPDQRLVEVRSDDRLIATTAAAVRVLETSHPPSFYLPPESIEPAALAVVAGTSLCEWKGRAEYLALSAGSSPVAWRYPAPFPEFAMLANYVAFYPDRVACFVDGEQVRPQASAFYGGWVTNEIVGPFKQ